MTSGPRRIPDALLERYLANALPTEVKADLEAMLSTGDQTRLKELHADSAAFLIQHPPRTIVERFQQAQERARWWRKSMLLAPILAATVAVLVFLRPSEDPSIAKGSMVLRLYRKTEHGIASVSLDVPLVPGDIIQLSVRAPASGFLAVLSQDAKGVITVYYPYGGEAAVAYNYDALFRRFSMPLIAALDDVPASTLTLFDALDTAITWAA